MTVSQTTQTANNNKCPHGYPIGACPICSGMMGAPKDRNKARKAGEMTYNECLMAWHKIQAQKEAKLEQKLELQKLQSENRLSQFLNKAQKFLEKYSTLLADTVSKMPLLVKFPIKFIIAPLLNILAKVPFVLNLVNNFIFKTVEFVSKMAASAAEKLSSLLGEIKNIIDFKKTKLKLKKALKNLLTLFIENKENKDEKEEKIKEILKGLFKIKSLKEKKNEHHKR